jgi:hypothetical protein
MGESVELAQAVQPWRSIWRLRSSPRPSHAPISTSANRVTVPR